MAGEDAGQRQWVVEPPGPRQVSIHMAFGEGVDLNDEQAAALDGLLRSLEAGDAEVTGHAAPCKDLSTCGTLVCPRLHNCPNLRCGTLQAVAAGGTAIGTLMGTFTMPVQ